MIHLLIALQLITSPVALRDTNNDGRIALDKMAERVVPKQARGTIVVPCGGNRYAVLGTQCADSEAPLAAPRTTLPFEPGKPTAQASRRSNLHMGRVLDGYVLDGVGSTIEDVMLDQARYGATMRRKDGSYGTVAGMTLRRIDWTVAEAGFAIRGGSHDITIEDATFRCTGTTDGIPAGIKIGAANSPSNYNITIRRTLVTGCSSSPDRKGYKQGDGIATERPDHHITITDTTVRDAGDGCLDLKSSATRLDNVTLDGCNWGARLWAQGTAGTVRVLRVNKAAVQIKPTTDWTIDRLFLPPVVPAQGDVFADGGGGHLTVKWCSRPLVTTQKLVQAALTLGEGCR